MAGNGGGGGGEGRGGEGVCDPIQEPVIVIKQNVSWKQLMKPYKTSGIFYGISTEESWTLCFQICKSWGFQGYM